MKSLNARAPAAHRLLPARAACAASAVCLAAAFPATVLAAAGVASPAAGCDSVTTTAEAGKAQDAPRRLPPAKGQAVTTAVALAEGRSVLRPLEAPVARLFVSDPCVLDAKYIQPNQLYLIGKRPGAVNVILWNQQGEASILDVTVNMDTAVLKASYAMLPERVGEALRITPAGDTLILSGTVSDVVQAEQVLALANAHLQRGRHGEGQGQAGGPKVVNMLAIAAPQQVMLEVKVAEVSKTLVDQLGASLGMSRTIGSWTYTALTNLLSNNPAVIDGFNNRNGNFLTLDAQKRDGLIKVLAEPTIMAISGQEASFLAGGKIFIPVAQTNNGGQQTITLEEKEFGVAVKFTPTVLAGGLINLKVAPEVSDLNKEGVGITATGVSTTAILPSFTTRRATTTVQLRDGQSFAIGGLIKNNVTTNVKAFPVLGEIPVLGALFRSSDFQTDRSELVFVITPRLVKPLPQDYRLPTDGYIQPSRSEFFLQGKLEGQPPAGQPAPAPTAAAPGNGGFDLK
ncbi:outer membrane channel protein [Massilia sp. Root418]|uniref:type II and III secretion system protein family protein n=1 Tax=Massilia sp. Root418 TaxID=1736532 RepID=UPI0006F375F2|nr:type II and III secretion system protein family protein [Massilia sp. Root418]KQW97051.1 outer membrane channel protein [Massilia sp. Root418]